MKPATISVFDDDDDEFSYILNRLGIKSAVAKTITYLKGVTAVRHRDIELGTGMTQQDTNNAIRWLRAKEWVSVMEVEQIGKRSYKMYRLVVSIDEIISVLEEDVLADVARTMEGVEEMKAFELGEAIE